MSATDNEAQDQAAELIEGVRLRGLYLVKAHRIGLMEMAWAAKLTKGALWMILAKNYWPARRDRGELRASLRNFASKAGVTGDQLAEMFQPCRWPEPTTDEEAAMLLPKQVITPAARKAFRLFENPFDGEVIDDGQMFVSESIEGVRELCRQAAMSGRFVALVGESGAGKTTIQADLETRLVRDHSPVIVIKPCIVGMEGSDRNGKTLKSADILAAIITALDQADDVPQTLEARSRRANKLLLQSTQAGFLHLLLIEEAHCMPDDTLKHLKRLHEMRLGRRPMLGILLLGQPELLTKLDPRKAALREVTQRCEVIDLPPLDNDLTAYLAHRARNCGRDLAEFIDGEGIEAIRERLTLNRKGRSAEACISMLYPLAVNNIMTAALNLAAEIGAEHINADVVRSI